MAAVFSEPAEMTSSPDLVWDDVDGHLVICDLVRNEFFELNKTAALIWRSIAAGGVASAERALRAAFPDLPFSMLEQDMSRIVDEFREAGLLICPPLTGVSLNEP